MAIVAQLAKPHPDTEGKDPWTLLEATGRDDFQNEIHEGEGARVSAQRGRILFKK